MYNTSGRVNRSKNTSFSGTGKNDPVAFLQSEKKRISEGTEIFKQELRNNWKRRHAGEAVFPKNILSVNMQVVRHLLSFEMVGKYDDIARKNGLDDGQRDAMPRIIWRCLLEGRLHEAEGELVEKLSIRREEAGSFRKMIGEMILEKLLGLNLQKGQGGRDESLQGVRGPVKERVNILKMTLQEALLKYPKLGDQLISSTPLRLRVFPEPVRPSIKNWIADYHDDLGVGKHGTIERGNFLFHGGNGKKLSSLERRKLAEVLKSLDEDSEISVDSHTEMLVFETSIQSQQVMHEAPQSFSHKDYDVKSAQPVQSLVQHASEYAMPSKQQPSGGLDVSEKYHSIPAKDITAGSVFVEEKKERDAGDILKAKEEERKRGKELNMKYGDFSVGEKERIERPEEDYDFLKSKKMLDDKASGNTWNPAQAVRERMEKNDAVNEKEKIRFSSAQVLPSEKKQFFSETRSQADGGTGNPSSAMVAGNESNSDDLMDRLRKMNKNSSSGVGAKSVFKITPTGFSDDMEGTSQEDDKSAGPMVKGNIVDLR